MTVLRAPQCNRLASVLGLSLVGMVWATVAAASEPAVRQKNVRVVAFYDYTHIDSDDVFAFPPGGGSVRVHASEIDLDEGGARGTYTFPLGHSLGARVIAGTTGSKVHPDGLEETKSGGIDLGGDIFLRDPERFEVGIGPRYNWMDRSRGSSDETIHSGGMAAYAKYFLKEFGVGPVDLDLSGQFMNMDSDVDISGALSARRTDSAGGGARVYLSDAVALRVGGQWTRLNYGGGGNEVTKAADFDLDVLLPFRPNVTLGADLTIGEIDQSIPGVANFGRQFFSMGISLTVSFPGVDSLVELTRFYY
jgi:hypothetical protein